MITSTTQHPVAQPACVSNQAANTADSMLVIKSATCARFGIKTKLIKVLVDGKQVAWQETDAGNPRSAVNVASLEAAIVAQTPSGKPWVDYDPIMQDMARNAAKSACKPVFAGD